MKGVYFVMHKEPLSTTPGYFNAETFGMPLGMVEGKGLVAWGTKEWLKLELSAPTPTSGEGSSQSLVASDLISLACAMRPPLKKRKPNANPKPPFRGPRSFQVSVYRRCWAWYAWKGAPPHSLPCPRLPLAVPKLHPFKKKNW